ncbi:MAG TPA: hypothetical protein VFI22_04265, partial [Thermomicrobiales bacterium]|nr:hypothetical protein [Thermomicrobiales bacterium]
MGGVQTLTQVALASSHRWPSLQQTQLSSEQQAKVLFWQNWQSPPPGGQQTQLSSGMQVAQKHLPAQQVGAAWSLGGIEHIWAPMGRVNVSGSGARISTHSPSLGVPRSQRHPHAPQLCGSVSRSMQAGPSPSSTVARRRCGELLPI